MESRRLKCGVIVTVIWIFVMLGCIAYDYSITKAMKPNEWGDFFAGFFAPLAFLWLVLGYLQQGQELQLSREALNLQAKELKNSVEQQRELVEITRQQVESERQALAQERISRKEAAKPSFVIKSSGFSQYNNKISCEIEITNAGNSASEVEAIFRNEKDDKFEFSLFEKNKRITIVIEWISLLPQAIFLISYIDADRNRGGVSYKVEEYKEQSIVKLKFIEISN